MMQRRHLEKAFTAGQFEISYLNDDRQRFQNVNQSCNRQKKFHFHDDSGRGQCAAKGHRACISHKELCGISVKYQKSQTCTGQRHTENRRAVMTKFHADDGKEKPNKSCNTGGQAVQSISQIHRICHGNNDKYNKRNVKSAKINILVDKRNPYLSSVTGIICHVECQRSREENLQYQLLPGTKTQIMFLCNFDIVVKESD